MILTYANQAVDDLTVAKCLFEAGDYDEADRIADRLIEEGRDLLAAYLLKAAIRSEQKRYKESLTVLTQAGPLVDSALPSLKARFYGQRAYLNKKLGDLDSPLVDYEAARYWAHEAGDELCEASIRNNLAKRYSELGRFDEAIHESDRAIRIATSLEDWFLLGRFLDLKAQILLDHDHAEQAVSVSRQAIETLVPLGNEVALQEARTTHGRSLIQFGSKYLQLPDRVEAFRANRLAVESLSAPLDKETIQLALERSGGRVTAAAALLGIRHSALIKAITKHGLSRIQRRRNKAIIKK